jgi:hypothetical protein
MPHRDKPARIPWLVGGCACARASCSCVSVSDGPTDGTWHADGARVGDAQQTRRGHARSSTHTSGVLSQHTRQYQSTGLALLRQQRALGVRSRRRALTRSRRRRL